MPRTTIDLGTMSIGETREFAFTLRGRDGTAAVTVTDWDEEFSAVTFDGLAVSEDSGEDEFTIGPANGDLVGDFTCLSSGSNAERRIILTYAGVDYELAIRYSAS